MFPDQQSAKTMESMREFAKSHLLIKTTGPAGGSACKKSLLWPIARAGFSASGSRLPEGRLVCNLFDRKNRAKIRILIPAGAFR